MNNDLLNETTGFLWLGLQCFIHKHTLRLICIPYQESSYDMDIEEFHNDIDEINNNQTSYHEIVKMTSQEEFQMMEDFTSTISDQHIRENFERILLNRKPFHHFKAHIHELQDVRQDWFNFKDTLETNFVKSQFEMLKIGT